MTSDRLYGADFLRAVACLTVLFHHLAQRLNWDINYGPAVNAFRSFAQMGTYGVAIFFVLSGFLLARPFWLALDKGEPMPSLRIYAMRRAARILPGYWLVLAVTFLLSVLLFDAVLDGQLLLRLAAGTLLLADWHWVTWFPVEVNGPLWSISVEATSYLLLPLCFAALFLLGSLVAAGGRGLPGPASSGSCWWGTGCSSPTIPSTTSGAPGISVSWAAPNGGCRATTRSAFSRCSPWAR